VPTCRALIADALIEIGVLEPGDTASAQQGAIGLLRLQNMIDAWAADRLTLAVQQRTQFTVLPGTSAVTIGLVGADITQARPVWINTMNFIVPGTSPEVESVMAQLDEDSFAALSIKQLSSALPTAFYYQTSMTTTLGTIRLWPVVTQAVDIVFYAPVGMTVPLALTDTIMGPPGYQEALVYQLALKLATPFGVAPPPLLVELATRAYATCKRPNVKPGLLGVDPALTKKAWAGGYNILTNQGG
jgi:hypothetical protein